jgi:hypothetical protein
MSETKSSKGRPAHLGTFGSLAEAQAVTPPSDKVRVFVVRDPSGKEVFTWAWGADQAIASAARASGYTARVAEPKAGGPITQERVAGFLADMTPEDRAVLIAQYVPEAPKKGKK